MISIRGRLAGAFLAAFAATAQAQKPAAQPAADSLIVSYITLGAGEELFDRFGHAAIRVRRPLSGLDSAWNWGMYDFNSPNFLSRWLTGDTQYWMAGYPTPLFVNYYRDNGRVVWEQELNLTQAQADSMLTLLRWNALPENKFYRYDYYLDNCSTRVRDAIDQILGGQLRKQLDAATPDTITWRSETLRLAAAFPYTDFGMTFALGRRADVRVTPWEEAFIPMRLRDRLRLVRVSAGANDERPLVRAEHMLNENGRYGDPKRAPALLMGAAFSALLGVALIWALARGAPANGWARLGLGVVGSTWHLLAGLAGTAILIAGLFTRHTFMGANTAVLLGTPVSLALVWFYPRGWSPKAGDVTRRAARSLSLLAAAAAGLAVIAHGSGLGPESLAPTALAAPMHVALAVALLRRAPVRA